MEFHSSIVEEKGVRKALISPFQIFTENCRFRGSPPAVGCNSSIEPRVHAHTCRRVLHLARLVFPSLAPVPDPTANVRPPSTECADFDEERLVLAVGWTSRERPRRSSGHRGRGRRDEPGEFAQVLGGGGVEELSRDKLTTHTRFRSRRKQVRDVPDFGPGSARRQPKRLGLGGDFRLNGCGSREVSLSLGYLSQPEPG